jgi:hypothetical protein
MAGKKGGRDVAPGARGWKVTEPGRQQAVSTHRTQANAERAAKRDLARAGGGEVRIHDPRGRIRDSDTVPPAKDPNPQKDRRH